MAFRRGFKTEARTLALETRAELGLATLDRLNPRDLAELLAIPIWSLSEFTTEYPLIEPLMTTERAAFSAVTVFCGSQRTIVHNDGHGEARQNSNLAHELAHGVLQHPPTAALDDRGCRSWNQSIEDEANWLAGELLVTFDAAMMIARGRWTPAEGAERLAVSEEMIRYRVNMTGARKIIQRANNARRAG